MTHDSALWAVGLMSGTSLDGIDVALIRTDGERVLETGPSATHPYDDAFRDRLRRHLGGKGSAAAIAATEAELTDRHARAVESLLRRAGIAEHHVGIVGFHGQTILHAPAERRTWQIGDGARLAQKLGVPVVNDFRSADVAAGGQGAPFVPVYHRALAHDLERPLGVLNLGGVANVTWIGGDRDALIACDTGPANALLDDWIAARSDATHDEDGRVSAAGRIDRARLDGLMSHPYFALPPPKSLDRDAFDVSSLTGLGAGGRRRHAGRLHRRCRRARAAASAAGTAPLAGGRRRAPQPDDHARAGGGAGRAGRGRRCRRLGRRCAGGAGLRLPRGALGAGPAAELPRHDRGAAAADRRPPEPALRGVSAGARGRASSPDSLRGGAPWPILRDAALRVAPQDEVGGLVDKPRTSS